MAAAGDTVWPAWRDALLRHLRILHFSNDRVDVQTGRRISCLHAAAIPAYLSTVLGGTDLHTARGRSRLGGWPQRQWHPAPRARHFPFVAQSLAVAWQHHPDRDVAVAR